MELIDPSDPEYELKVAAAFQSAVDDPRPGDDEPVVLTRRQAQKVAAIMSAVSRGHDGYREALLHASWFLDCAAAESIGPEVITSTAAEAWKRVDTFPWPRPGKPRPQPE